MANKSISKLTPRNQGNIVSQIHKLIKTYVDFFVIRERVYIKNLAKIDGTIYWLADPNNELIAMAILEPTHEFELDGVLYKTLGHIISKKIGIIDRVISHIWEDHKEINVIAFSRPNLSHALVNGGEKLVEFSTIDLMNIWPEMANRKTDYFNVKNETTLQAMMRKSQNLYIKFSPEAIEEIEKTNPKLHTFVNNSK
jgi:hypothetical protein